MKAWPLEGWDTSVITCSSTWMNAPLPDVAKGSGTDF